MERNDPSRTSERDQPKWNRLLLTLLVGVVVVQWGSVPLFEWLRPDATMNDRMVVVKGITFVFFAAVIMRSTGWAAVGFRRPTRPGSLFYGTPCFLLAAMALAGGVSPKMTMGAFAYMTLWLTFGVLVEEIVFRGVMWEAVASRGPFFTAISTSVGFGMFHVLGIGSEIATSVILAQMCAAVGIGMVIAAVRVAAGTIWTAIAAHWVFNAMSFVGSGGVADTLSPGVEMQFVAAGVVLALIGLGLVALASRRSSSRGDASPTSGPGMALSEAGAP
jgi:membrane protease YdiL (CAAX protease family)